MIPKDLIVVAVGVGALSESSLSAMWQTIIVGTSSLIMLVIVLVSQRRRDRKMMTTIEDRITHHIDTSTAKILEALPPKPKPPARKRQPATGK